MSLTLTNARLGQVVLAIASLLICIGLCEIGFRLISSDKYYVWTPGLRHIVHPAPAVIPGIERESRFTINNYGLRGDSFSNDQTYRILAIGGSTTECLFLDDSEAWPYLLQGKLNERAGSKRSIWVGNVGKRGHNTRNHIVQVEMLLKQYPRIDAVLLLIGVNDFGLRLAMDEQYRPFPAADKLSFKDHQALMDVSFSVWPHRDWQHSEILRRFRSIKNRYLNPGRRTAVDLDAGQISQWRTYRKMATSIRHTLPDLSSALQEYSINVNKIIDHARSKGTRLIFMTQPTMWRSGLSREEQSLLWWGGVGNFQASPGHEYYSVEVLAKGMKRYNDTLLRICDTKNVECIDLESQLSKDVSNFYDDMHFNEGGAANVATVISNYLARHEHPYPH